MRPLYLEMTAFGSYAETTALPFEKLRSGLYLVTGETGAGKTTIFDAIVFALYGMPSGSERKTEMLHCDYVPKSTDTVVKLRFLQGGKEYTVQRSLHFQRKRGTEEQYGDPKPEALLWEPERPVLEGATKVSNRCEQLLGLNVDQFRKIIMLAQGEFRQFLKADSEGKSEILGKLFDNSAYVYYQNLLEASRTEMRVRRQAASEQLRTLLEARLQLPENMSEERKADFLPGNPGLLAKLDSLTASEAEQLVQLQEGRDGIRTAIDAANTQRGAAELMNGQLRELEERRTHLSALEKSEPEIQLRRETLHIVDRALHRARPTVLDFERADVSLAAAEKELEKRRMLVNDLERTAADAQACCDGDQGKKTELTGLAAEQAAIEKQIPQYHALTQRRADWKTAGAAVREAGRKAADLEHKLVLLTKELETLSESLRELESADAERISAENARDRAEERLEALDGENGIRAERKKILDAQAQAVRETETLQSLSREAADAEQNYHMLYQHFLAGQAGFLAQELRMKLEHDGQAVCPVCSSHLLRERLSELAELPAETPNRETVNAAREYAAETEQRRSGQDKRVEGLRTGIRSRQESLLNRVSALLPDCGSWEQLTAPGYLETEIEASRSAAAEAEAALKRAAQRQQRRDTDRKRLSERQKEQEKLRQERESQISAARSQEAAVLAAEAAIAELEKQLSYPDEAKALERRKALHARQQTITTELADHEAALEQALTRLNTEKGRLREQETRLLQLQQERGEKLVIMEHTLADNGFSDPKSVRQALEPCGGTDEELWLRQEQQSLTEYESDCRHTRERVTVLEKQTQGQKPTDLEKLAQEITEMESAYQTANDGCTALEKLLDNHREICTLARNAQNALNHTEKAWKRLNRLADLAVGTASEGGKLSFERFVMGTVFREVLEMANRRMDVISGGKYELVHKTEADRRNAKAGLEIEVLDMSTGQQRSAASLSGGEAFFTSLALALGLSDVVQNHAGGKRMEALFIDEGFGSLSDDVLSKALEVLNQLTEGDRLVGIISHVDKLDESIPQKIRVHGSERGSSLTLELA